MTQFVSPNPGSEQPPSLRPLEESAQATHPPGRRRSLLLLSLLVWLILGFSTGVYLALPSWPGATTRPDVAAGRYAQPMTMTSPRRSFAQTRFWRPAGSIAERPKTELEPRRFRPALRLDGSP